MFKESMHGLLCDDDDDDEFFCGMSDRRKTFNPSRPNPGRREKIKLNFYFHTSLWCLKRFYEGLKSLHKDF